MQTNISKFYKDRTILITGGVCHIGSCLTQTLSSIDFKFESSNISPWNMHRGNIQRTGLYTSISSEQQGDINQDSNIDIVS